MSEPALGGGGEVYILAASTAAMNTNLISDGDADPGAARGNPAHAPLSATPQDNKVFGVPTVKLGTMRGIAISVHPFLLGLPVFMAISHASAGAAGAGLAFVLYGPLLFGVILIHELSHCTAARALGGEATEILLWPLGGIAFIGGNGQMAPMSDAKVAAAGPASHVPLILLCLALVAACNGGDVGSDSIPNPKDDFATAMFWEWMWMNVGLMLFNLCIPCYPLDGSRILMAFLQHGQKYDNSTIARIIVYISVPILLCLIVLGIWMIANGAMWGINNLLVALWMAFETYQLWQLQETQQFEAHPLFKHAAGWVHEPAQPETC